METNLKPCAHCGGAARLVKAKEGDVFLWAVVECYECRAQTSHCTSDDLARDLWNRRDGEERRIAEAVAAAVSAERARWLSELDKRIEKAENGKGDPYLWAAISGLLRGYRAFMQEQGGEP